MSSIFCYEKGARQRRYTQVFFARSRVQYVEFASRLKTRIMNITSSIPRMTAIFQRLHVVLRGHFALKAPRTHALYYVAKEMIAADPRLLSQLCLHLALQFRDDDIETVVAPAVLGGPLAHSLAWHLTHMYGRTVHSVIADKISKKRFIIGRSYAQYVRGRRVLIADDVITEGTSVRALMKAVWAVAGETIAVGILIDRGDPDTRLLDTERFVSLVRLRLPTYQAGQGTCPGCQKNMPLSTTHGHGRRHS